MKIPLKPDVNPMILRPYRLNPKYKEKVKEEIDRMLEAWHKRKYKGKGPIPSPHKKMKAHKSPAI
jgi:hypothetical protein